MLKLLRLRIHYNVERDNRIVVDGRSSYLVKKLSDLVLFSFFFCIEMRLKNLKPFDLTNEQLRQKVKLTFFIRFREFVYLNVLSFE